MTPLLLQVLGPHDRLHGIHNRFVSGGSTPGDVGLVLLLGAAFVAFLYVLFRMQRRWRRKEIDNSGKLFRTLLLDLGLSPADRSLLMAVARDRRLTEPAILLLGPSPFWRHVRPWSDAQPGRRRPGPEVVERLATRLFGRPSEMQNSGE
ncbi:MAG: hypothetical protein JXB13_15820 [Phycisphaerae bacterium]|nr:hypothetical protein [Phycisphaerae bacterium]